MMKVGLTGSIGMGKSTTAAMFKDMGCLVWDADAAVHRLYSKNGRAVPQMKKCFPNAVVDGGVDRNILRSALRQDPKLIETLNRIVHPLVAQDRAAFVENAKADIAIFDIPLLFENGMEDEFHATVCVLTSQENQLNRVLARNTMNKADLDLILSNQMSAIEKAEQADFVICTDTLETAKRDVSKTLQKLKGMIQNA